MKPLFSAAFLLACLAFASADAVVLKTGERFVGDVSEEGDSWRIKSDRFPEGVVVKKTDVKAVYPKADAMLAKLDAAVAKAKERYDAGKKAADPNADMKAVVDMLFDPELEAADGAEVYPDRKKDFDSLTKRIHELRKMARDGQAMKGPPVDPKPDPKPEPKPDPRPDPKPVPKPDPKPDPGPQDFSDRATIWLVGPDGASKADLEKAAKQMAARCETYGYSGVKGKVDAGSNELTLVRLDVEGGFTASMVQTVGAMGRHAAKTFEMRCYYYPSPGETEQFRVPTDSEVLTAKAPPGAKWHRRVRFSVDGPEQTRDPTLMRLSPAISRSEILPPYKDKPDYAADFYVVSEAAESRLKAAFKGAGAVTIKCELLVDDVVIVTDLTPPAKDHPKDGRVWWRHTFTEKERKILDGYRTAGMPIPLRVVDELK
jgi:outer membrane biosynthesis protein TonB